MQHMVIWPLPMTRRGYTLDDCLTNYLADAVMSDRECFRCGGREAVMKRTVVSWPRFVYSLFFIIIIIIIIIIIHCEASFVLIQNREKKKKKLIELFVFLKMLVSL
jgi:hypothetical protein